MNDRTVPFDPKQKCDTCDHLGAYDFYGDYVCEACLAWAQAQENTEEDFYDE